jgi:hypothetical protein
MRKEAFLNYKIKTKIQEEDAFTLVLKIGESVSHKTSNCIQKTREFPKSRRYNERGKKVYTRIHSSVP